MNFDPNNQEYIHTIWCKAHPSEQEPCPICLRIATTNQCTCMNRREGMPHELGCPLEPSSLGPSRVDHPFHYGGDTTYEAIKELEAKVARLEADLATEKKGRSQAVSELEAALEARWRVHEKDIGKLRRLERVGRELAEEMQIIAERGCMCAEETRMDPALICRSCIATAALAAWDTAQKGGGA